jgi:hypothetical protein
VKLFETQSVLLNIWKAGADYCFGGSLNDAECIRLIGIARGTDYKYKRQMCDGDMARNYQTGMRKPEILECTKLSDKGIINVSKSFSHC